MSANVENMFYVREKPWHGLGKRIEEAPTSADALIYAGLDWEVIQKDVYTRSTDSAILGIVSDRYKVVQNSDAFQFTDDLLGSGVTYENCRGIAGRPQGLDASADASPLHYRWGRNRTLSGGDELS